MTVTPALSSGLGIVLTSLPLQVPPEEAPAPWTALPLALGIGRLVLRARNLAAFVLAAGALRWVLRGPVLP